jgi:hypothetical protein
MLKKSSKNWSVFRYAMRLMQIRHGEWEMIKHYRRFKNTERPELFYQIRYNWLEKL